MTRLLTHLVLDRRLLVYAVVVVATVAAAIRIPGLRVDTDFGVFLPEQAKEWRELRETARGEGRAALYVLLDDVARLEEFAARLRDSHAFAQVDLARQAVLGGGELPSLYGLDEPALQAIEERLGAGLSPALLAMRVRLATDPVAGREVALRDPLGLSWILEDAVARRLPQGLDPDSPYVAARDGRSALLLVHGRADASDVEYARRAVDAVRSAAATTGVGVHMIGGYAEAAFESRRMRQDLVFASWMSALLVAGYLAVSLRSVRAAPVLLLPTIVAIVWMLGFGNALLGAFNPLAAAAAAMLAGLGVDFAIHFTARLGEERGGRAPRDALAATYRGTGRLLLLALATTLVAFAPFATGSIPGLRQFAWLLGIGLVAAMLVTLLVLPSLPGAPAVSGRPGPFIRLCMRLRHRRAASLVLVLAGAAGAAAIPRLTFTTDPSRFRSPDHPVARAEREVGRALGFSPRPVTVVATDPREMERRIRALRERGIVRFSQGAHALASSERVAALRAAVAGWRARAESALRTLDLETEPFEAAWDRVEELLAHGPPPPDAHYRLFLPLGYERDAALHETLQKELGPSAKLLDLESMRARVAPLLRDEMGRAFLIAVPGILLLVLVSLRRPRLVVGALLPVSVGLGITAGVLYLADAPIHPGNLVALPFLLGLGIDDGVHMAGRVAEDDRDPLPTTGQAVFRTSATSLLAFGTLTLATTPALRSLGSALALGISACLLATVVILPAWARR